MKYLFLALAIFLPFEIMAKTWRFGFDDSSEEWGTWGDGVGKHDKSEGNKSKGSLFLSTDYSSVQTYHYSINKLVPGNYKITFWVKALNVLSDEKNDSFWHFVDGGSGQKDIFRNLHGSYNWRKVEYSVLVSEDILNLWFRLKSTGSVWIDDIEITSTDQMFTAKIENPKNLFDIKKTFKNKHKKYEKNVILDFDSVKPHHPFKEIFYMNSKMGQMLPHEFYNLNPSHYGNGKWDKYDYLNLEVYNPNKESALFTLALGDAQSFDYWTQVNHKTYLTPGLNRLSFPIRQMIGERGSHRYQRFLNLDNLRKWFVIVDPDKKQNNLRPFVIDNISLESRKIPEKPQGLWSFDFTSIKNEYPSDSVKVYSMDTYSPSKGYGFVNSTFWRVEDSVYAPSDLRYTIGVLNGNFKVRIPNGIYKIYLNIERLGYWDVSFWSNREIYINNKIALKERRDTSDDYLKDYLMFSSVIPKTGDHPIDLYIQKVFNYKTFEVEVKNEEIDFSFLSDATGISLNHLVIVEKKNDERALNYFDSLRVFRKSEFDRLARYITPAPKVHPENIKLINLSLGLREDETNEEARKEISWVGTRGESLYQVIELHGEGRVDINFKGKDELFFKDKVRIFEIIPQIISPDLNHEAYFYGGKYIRPLTDLNLVEGQSKYIYLEISHNESSRKKLSSLLEVTVGMKKATFPISLDPIAFDLPKIDFPVGFFGPDLVQINFSNNQSVEKVREEYRIRAISQLADAGFTTFTGLPSVYTNGRFDSGPLKRLVSAANSVGMLGTYFSYGGSFPGELLDQSEATIYSILNDVPGKLVYTFSDEPGGYSDRVGEDLKLAKHLKQNISAMLRGGFSNLDDKNLTELNRYFDYPFYSHVKSRQLVGSWGAYNAAAGALNDPRFVLSAGLHYARKRGLTHYLEWHGSAIHNYPYYDLDGRESDIELFMAAPDKTLYPTIKFILARQGIQTFRKIKLIEEQMKKIPNYKRNELLFKLDQGKYSDPTFLLNPTQGFDFDELDGSVNKILLNLK